MTDTSTAVSAPRALLSLLLDLVAFACAWWGLLTPPPLNVWWILVGLAVLLGVPALPSRIAWGATGVSFVVLWLLPGDVAKNLILPACLVVGVVIPAVIVWKLAQRFRVGRRIIRGDLTINEARFEKGLPPLRDSTYAPPPARRVIGLHGYAGAGKDTAALALIAQGWTRVSFADVLRAFCYAQNPWVQPGHPDDDHQHVRLRDLVDQVGWQRAKVENEDVRRLLQRTGTEAGRLVLGENVWVQAALAGAPDNDLVFTDVRFKNEADAIRAVGGLIFRVDRPGVGPVNEHISDNALADYEFDGVLRNNGDVEDLQRRLRELVAASR